MFGGKKRCKDAKSVKVREAMTEYELRYENEKRANRARLDGLVSLAQQYSLTHPERLSAITRMLAEKALLHCGIDMFACEGEHTSMLPKTINAIVGDEAPKTPINDVLNSGEANMGIEDYLFGDFVDETMKDRLLTLLQSRPMKGEVTLDLAYDAVFASPWKSYDLVSDFFTLGIGKETNPFTQDAKHHMVTLYLPLGIAVMGNGNHSAFCGVYRRRGGLTVRRAYDVSEVYNEIYFDGDVWRAIDDTRVVAKAGVWEVCAVFEMTRPRRAVFDGDRLRLSPTQIFNNTEFKLDFDEPVPAI